MKRGLQLVLGTVLFFFGWVSASPGTELLQLDKYQRMAYRVKPAIVRVLAMVQGTVAYETEQGKKTDKEIFTGGVRVWVHRQSERVRSHQWPCG